MPAIDAIIQYGEISNFRMVDEPHMLVQSLTIKPEREKQSWKSASTLAVNALRFTNPMISFAFTALISDIDGLVNQHPGTLVTELMNFSGNIYQFDPDEGIMVFEDPTRSLTLDNPAETSFSVVQYPFLGSTLDSWTPDPYEAPVTM
jgi:hypothetical protein